ncbi:uncharacterized protein DS421_1g32640 [Arachis hypogaea]|nr:uncharacterized protein DS421_1g32640 [Arachis hypogaea]
MPAQRWLLQWYNSGAQCSRRQKQGNGSPVLCCEEGKGRKWRKSKKDEKRGRKWLLVGVSSGKDNRDGETGWQRQGRGRREKKEGRGRRGFRGGRRWRLAGGGWLVVKAVQQWIEKRFREGDREEEAETLKEDGKWVTQMS